MMPAGTGIFNSDRQSAGNEWYYDGITGLNYH